MFLSSSPSGDHQVVRHPQVGRGLRLPRPLHPRREAEDPPGDGQRHPRREGRRRDAPLGQGVPVHGRVRGGLPGELEAGEEGHRHEEEGRLGRIPVQQGLGFEFKRCAFDRYLYRKMKSTDGKQFFASFLLCLFELFSSAVVECTGIVLFVGNTAPPLLFQPVSLCPACAPFPLSAMFVFHFSPTFLCCWPRTAAANLEARALLSRRDSGVDLHR